MTALQIDGEFECLQKYFFNIATKEEHVRYVKSIIQTF